MSLENKGKSVYTDIRETHNIMIFIGNGFDISVLKKYGKDNLISSYDKFYDFLLYHGYCSGNILVKQMKDDKDAENEDWSDFEASLGKLAKEGNDINILERDLAEIQDKFLEFLYDIVTPEILQHLSKDASKNEWGTKTMSHFLGDLREQDYRIMNFPAKTNHKDLYNFSFINFNYTFLFDDYIYLDKIQFNPHIHKSSDRNFHFYPNPRGYERNDVNYFKSSTGEEISMGETDSFSSYIDIDISHPHGNQNIPRSLLFGTEEDKGDGNQDLTVLRKSFWAQNELKYGERFKDAELFIVSGMSLGKSDSWWWNKIYVSLRDRDAELIIYYYLKEEEPGNRGISKKKPQNENEVKKAFIDSCDIQGSKGEVAHIKEKIYVVMYKDSDEINAFGFRPKKEDEIPQQSKLLNN